MAITIGRRELLAALGGAATMSSNLWPRAARAQQPAMPVIGFLHAGSPEANARFAAGFRKGLGETGYVEGRDVAIEYRWAHGESDRLPELAADLVRRGVAVIAAPGSIAAALTTKAATTTIPIVFMTGADPVQTGLVASLNRPGGNVTGIAGMNVELTAKQLGLLHELLPGAARIAVLVNSNDLSNELVIRRDVQAAAAAIGRQVEFLTTTSARDIGPAFTTLVQNRAGALLIGPDALFTNRRVQLATLAARHALPTIYHIREFPEVGGLMSYGPNFMDLYREAGIYTGKILKGQNPAELPILQATKFEFVINLQTAAALGLEVPPKLLALADEVIE